jgi:hypothetical protein
MSQLIILDNTGDTRHDFTPDDADSVARCMEAFESMTKKGHWAVDNSVIGAGKVIKAFDRTATRITMHPQLIGG